MTGQLSLRERFERYALTPSRAAAGEHLAAGFPITYVEEDTPTGYLLRQYPDGRVEMVAVETLRSR